MADDEKSASGGSERRVLLWFALATIPPLLLIGYLSWVAAANDRGALRQFEEERAREVAGVVRLALEQAVREAESACLRAVDGAKLRACADDAQARVALEADLASIQSNHPIAARFFLIEEGGRVLVPDARAPFRQDGAQDDADEELEDQPPSDAAALARRQEARHAYERGLELERAGKHPEAIADFRTAATTADAPPSLRARAGARLARLLEAKKDLAGAVLALAELDKEKARVRDERGQPLRARAALRRGELLLELERRDDARAAASKLARELLDSRHRELARADWDDLFARALKLLVKASQESGVPAHVAALEKEAQSLRGRLAWAVDLARDLGDALARAAEAKDEVLHLSRLRDPPLVLAYRVIGAGGKKLAFGFETNLERLARDVLGPACAEESFRHGASFAVVDGHQVVRAYGGRDAVPGDDGRPVLTAESIGAVVPFEPPPLWQLRAVRDSTAFSESVRRRTLVYVGLVLLAVGMAGAGGFATIRAVQRSLELARLKQDFVSNVTHELKTPLTSIRMFAEMLSLGRVPTEERKKEYLSHIVSESSRLQKLIEDILDFARIDAGKTPYVLAEGDVADTVAEAIDLFRHGAQIRGFDLFVDLPPVGALPPADLDRDAIVRSVLNLLSNAAKYSGDSRTIKVKVAREGDDLAVSVEDNGIGIDKEDLDKVFDRFFRAGDLHTRGVSGAGLGLSLVDQIMQAHGGRIRVESEKGKGSTFTLLLPIVPDYRNVAWPPPEAAVQEKPGGEPSS